jgi:rhodanese-related sulfurtransferase
MTTAVDRDPELPKIGLEELSRRVRERSVLVADVLSAESYRAGHIPGAIHLPVAELPARARELVPDPDREIVLYCGSET